MARWLSLLAVMLAACTAVRADEPSLSADETRALLLEMMQLRQQHEQDVESQVEMLKHIQKLQVATNCA